MAIIQPKVFLCIGMDFVRNIMQVHEVVWNVMPQLVFEAEGQRQLESRNLSFASDKLRVLPKSDND